MVHNDLYFFAKLKQKGMIPKQIHSNKVQYA